MCCVLLLFWSHDLTGQSELLGYLTWPIRTIGFFDLGFRLFDFGWVYCAWEITLARMFFLALGLKYVASMFCGKPSRTPNKKAEEEIIFGTS